MTAGADRPTATITVRVIRPGYVFVATTAATQVMLDKEGWVLEEHSTFNYTDKSRTRMVISHKYCEHDAIIHIPQVGWTGTIVLMKEQTPMMSAPPIKSVEIPPA